MSKDICRIHKNLPYVMGVERSKKLFYTCWSFAEKTFVKQNMMLCVFEILLKNGRKISGNLSSMNLSSVAGHAWAVMHELCHQSCMGGHARKTL